MVSLSGIEDIKTGMARTRDWCILHRQWDVAPPATGEQRLNIGSFTQFPHHGSSNYRAVSFERLECGVIADLLVVEILESPHDFGFEGLHSTRLWAIKINTN